MDLLVHQRFLESNEMLTNFLSNNKRTETEVGHGEIVYNFNQVLKELLK